jgi:hypothetical protein
MHDILARAMSRERDERKRCEAVLLPRAETAPGAIRLANALSHKLTERFFAALAIAKDGLLLVADDTGARSGASPTQATAAGCSSCSGAV